MKHLDFKVGDMVLVPITDGVNNVVEIEVRHITDISSLRISGMVHLSWKETGKLVPSGVECVEDLHPWDGTPSQMDYIYRKLQHRVSSITPENPLYRLEIDGQGAFVTRYGVDHCKSICPHLGGDWKSSLDGNFSASSLTKKLMGDNVELYKYTAGEFIRLNGTNFQIDHSKPFTREKLTF